ncbi:MAG: ROK family transcriptional regulator [Spirochaetales bacterium]|nr:ROK family transcriptional regulator [Spirochaetales bacterium]
MKTINISRVLRLLWQKKGITRIDIAEKLSLDKSTITKIMNILLDRQFVLEMSEGEAGPQGGRKPIHLTINKDFGCVAGFEVQPNYWKLIVVNLEGDMVYTHTQATQINADNIIPVLIDAVGFLKTKMDELNKKLIGIGIGASGIMNPQRGIINQSIPLQINTPVDILTPLSEHIDVPLYLDNDANCGAWGELAFHKSPHLQNFIFLLIEIREDEIIQKKFGGLAVGLGVVLNNKVYYGSSFSAGEFRSVFSKKEDINQFSLHIDDVVSINRKRETFIRFADEIAENIALLVNVLNVSNVFIAHINVHFHDVLIPILEKTIQEKSPYQMQPPCVITNSSYGEEAVAYGAAGIILEHIFAHPEIPQSSERKVIDPIDIILTI